jgi:hypothetical protein
MYTVVPFTFTPYIIHIRQTQGAGFRKELVEDIQDKYLGGIQRYNASYPE